MKYILYEIYIFNEICDDEGHWRWAESINIFFSFEVKVFIVYINNNITQHREDCVCACVYGVCGNNECYLCKIILLSWSRTLFIMFLMRKEYLSLLYFVHSRFMADNAQKFSSFHIYYTLMVIRRMINGIYQFPSTICWVILKSGERMSTVCGQGKIAMWMRKQKKNEKMKDTKTADPILIILHINGRMQVYLMVTIRIWSHD